MLLSWPLSSALLRIRSSGFQDNHNSDEPPLIAFYRTLSEVKRVLKPGGKFYYMEHIIAQEVTTAFCSPFSRSTKCNEKHEHVVLKVWLNQGRPLRYLQQGLMLGGKGSLWKKLFWDFSRLLFCFRKLTFSRLLDFPGRWLLCWSGDWPGPSNLKLVVEIIFKFLSE